MEEPNVARVKIILTARVSSHGRSSLRVACKLALACLVVFLPVVALAQQPTPSSQTEAPVPSTPAASDQEEAPLPGDWAPELLYGIWNSPNSQAADALYHAAFAAGPPIIPQLQEALKDDRTAEFAAQSLAFIGGEKALKVLDKLVADPRDLNLRRFFYGALGEFDSPQATDILFNVINKSDSEPDRTVTEAAIIALTVRTDPALLPRLRAAEAKLQDVVIRDDLENAYAVIDARAKYLTSPAGKKLGGSLQEAVHTYFIPALEASSDNADSPGQRKIGPKAAETAHANHRPPISVEIRSITFSPDKTRALAHVVFEDPSALANYSMVLQKQAGNWTLASVWLGLETEKAPATAPPAAPRN